MLLDASQPSQAFAASGARLRGSMGCGAHPAPRVNAGVGDRLECGAPGPRRGSPWTRGPASDGAWGARHHWRGWTCCESEAPAPISAEERATLAFFSVEGIGPATLAGLRERFGTLADALAAPKKDVAAALRDEPTRARFLAAGDLGALADRHLERAEQLGARVLFAGRPNWPRQLAGLEFPPILYVRGRLDPAQPRVALVGSRQADEYGLEQATLFSASFARAVVGVVSGGAIGVDAAAHRACLGNAGSTIAVLGSGVDLVYPPEHRTLFQEIVAQGGALVSHYPPGTPAVPQNFVVRNKVIAALADATVVIRAGLGSGALGTADAASALRRPLFAVPADVTCAMSAGTNSLLESGKARAACSPAAVASAIGLPGEWRSPGTMDSLERPRARSAAKRANAATLRAAPPAVEIPPEWREVYDALGEGPAQFDDLLRQCGLDATRLANVLLRLELSGLCEERVGKVFTRR